MLKLISLCKRFGDVRAVENISFNLEQGEAVALLGPSGSGKTTILRLIAGFEQPDSGQAWLHERLVSDSNTTSPPHQRDIGFVFQQPTLWPHMTVWQHLLFAARERPDRAVCERLQGLLEITGLHDLANRYPGEISGGQARRVGLARALAARPRLLLMDEPFTNLHEQAKEEMRTIVLTTVRESGCGMLFVTHDEREAEAMTARSLRIDAGQLVTENSLVP